MQRFALLILLGACKLSVDYTGTNYQCNPDGTCPPNFECVDMVCQPSDPIPPACSDDVSAGAEHSCAVRKDGTVWCWGRNDYGQLGDGTAADSAMPVKVVSMQKFTAVAAGELHTCALDSTGAVMCWGRNDQGQLGDGTTSDSRSPVAVMNVSGVAKLAVGYNHTCVLKTDGTLSCWGANGAGELGDGTTTSHNTATAVDAGGQVSAISAGGDTTCAVLMDGSMKCWGENNDGELGVGDTGSHPRPTAVVGVTNVVQPANGNNFTCALTKSGDVYCAGVNQYGQLGDGTTNGSNKYVQTLLPVSAIDIDAGDVHACVIDGNHTPWCWGIADDGRGLDANDGARLLPVRGVLEDIVKITAGGEHTCTIDSLGAIRCAGYNRRGALGDGRTVTRGGPTTANVVTDATLVATGDRHTCAAQMDGRILCWGSTYDGQGGSGTFVSPQVIPQQVFGIANAKELVAGSVHTCALLQDNTVFCWGKNDQGQLGDGTNTSSPSPRQVGAIGTLAKHLIASDATTCALSTNGAYCWGNMFDNTPQLVSGVKSIGVGSSHVCTLESNDAVLCYGEGYRYQLGNGTSGQVGPPGVTPNGVATAADVFAHGEATCAKLADGTAKCWGLNDGARLGTGMGGYTINQPTAVSGLSGFSKFAMGHDGSCALKPDGTVWCWGTNYIGGVGDGTYTTRNGAVQISSLTGVKDIAAAGDHACAVTSDGKVACWGQGANGQLGNGIKEIEDPVGVRMTCQ